MLSTVLRPDGGDVSIGGHSVLDRSDRVRQLIGVCPQDIALYVELSAIDNLVFFGKMAGLSGAEAKERAYSILDRVGLTDRAKGAVLSSPAG